MIQPHSWKDERVLITGGTGMLGTALGRILTHSGARVTLLSRKPLARSEAGEWLQCDVQSTEALASVLRSSRIGTVFHLAAQTQVGTARQAPVETFEANIRGTWNVLEAARAQDASIPVILASSAAVKSKGPSSTATAANGGSLDPYSTSKMCAELLARCYFDTFGLRVCVARLTSLYGPGDANPKRLVPGTILNVLHGQQPILRSDGQAEINYLYVDDAAIALMRLVEALPRDDVAGHSFVVSHNQSIKVLEMVELILRLTGRTDMKPHVEGRNESAAAPKASPSVELEHLLGWAPEIGLEEGLKRTITWYREHGF